MTQGNAPTHPASQQAPANTYYQPNQALQAAQANQAYAQADKARSEAAVLQQQGLGMPTQAPQAPVQDQASQLASALVSGQMGVEEIQMAVQNGQLDPAVADAAMGMAQQSMAQPQGLGGL